MSLGEEEKNYTRLKVYVFVFVFFKSTYGTFHGHSKSFILSKKMQTVKPVKPVVDCNDRYILSRPFHTIKKIADSQTVSDINFV